MSYRYTAAKKQQANRKFAQKQLGKKSTTKKPSFDLKKSRKTTANGSKQKNRSAKPVKANGQKKSKKWLETAGAIVWKLGLVILLIYLTFVLLMKFFLPNFFSLNNEERNLLLIGGTPGEKATVIYILRLSASDDSVKVFLLDSQALVPVSGGYGSYPLGNVAPFLQLEADQNQKLTAVYNFALKQAIDEVYFIPDLKVPKDEKQVKKDFWRLIKKELALTTQTRAELWKIFFFLQKDTSFIKNSLKINDEGTNETSLAKEKKTQCPVVLINTTKINGLASKVSLMMEMNGAVVVNLENNEENLTESEIYYDQNEPVCTELINVLQNSLTKIGKIVPDEGKLGAQNRAKAVIKLGQSLSN